MPKILTAKTYPEIPRMVVTVVLNPDEPEALHADGKAHTGSPPVGTPAGLKSWEWCPNCRYNWQVVEKVWTGAELLNPDKTPKTNDQLIAELQNHVAKALPTVTTLTALEGATL